MANQPLRILVVDDEPDLRRAVARPLQQAGYPVAEAATGQEGLRRAHQEHPDLILLDVTLPDMDGQEVCRRIRADPDLHCYVVLLLGVQAAADEQIAGVETYANGYISRPLADRELLVRVQTLLRLRQAEQALRESEAQFRRVIEQSQDGITLTDEQGRVILWNPAMEQLTGLPAAEVLGQTIWDVQFRLGLAEQQTPARYEQLQTMIQSLLRSGQAPWLGQVQEREYQHPDGTHRFIQGTVFPIPTDKGFLLGSISRDVTERRQAEEQSRRQHAFLTSVLEAVAHPFYVIDARDYAIRMANSATAVYGSLAPDTPCYALTHQAARPCAGAEHPCPLAEVQRTRQPVVVEHIHYAQDGSPRIYEVHGFPILDPAGHVAQMIEYALDVTERKRAEAALQERVKELNCLYGISALVEQPGISLPEILQGTVALLPPAWQHPEIAGARILLDGQEFRTANFQETPWMQARDIVVHGEAAGRVEVCYLADEGPFLKEEHALLHVIAERLGHIIERVRLGEALARSNAELQRLTYVAAHHLQEPARVVVTHSQLLARRYHGQLGAEADELIDHIVAESTYMRRLARGLLAYAQLDRQAGLLALTDCEALLGRVLAGLRQDIAASGAVITHDPLPTVLADEAQLVQVFQHLIGNALKFRRPDEPLCVHISAHLSSPPGPLSSPAGGGEGVWGRGGVWLFSVRDNGIGIDPAQAGRLFQLFQRLHPRDEYPGAGIGLALCRKIVERHGGRIWVESLPGQGATFYFTLKRET